MPDSVTIWCVLFLCNQMVRVKRELLLFVVVIATWQPRANLQVPIFVQLTLLVRCICIVEWCNCVVRAFVDFILRFISPHSAYLNLKAVLERFTLEKCNVFVRAGYET